MFVKECLRRGVEPTALVGGQLADLIAQDVKSMPPLRLRERAWMQLLAEDTKPETTKAYTVSAERVRPKPVRRQIR